MATHSTAASSIDGLLNTFPVLTYAARCSIPLSAALAVIVAHEKCAAAPNPFHCDFVELMLTVGQQILSSVKFPSRWTQSGSDQLYGDDPRTYSYITLALYRFLRHLIPHTDAIAPVAQQGASAAPPSSPASTEVAWAVMQGRICELFPPGELRAHALDECQRYARHSSMDHYFTPQQLLAIDAADDSHELSDWQRWLITSPAWQRLAGVTVEYALSEILETLGFALKQEWSNCCQAHLKGDDDEKDDDEDMVEEKEDEEEDRTHKDESREDRWLRAQNRIACFHNKVLTKDEELAALWRTIGMPADSPPELDVDPHTASKQQIDRHMQAAVAAAAPWMFDSQQVERRVADWVQGRLSDGDAVFFRRFHIRPVWHASGDGFVSTMRRILTSRPQLASTW